MSQRTVEVNEEVLVTLQVKVKLNSFSNHEGLSSGKKEQAIKEFKEEIKGELLYELFEGNHNREFLNSVDFVDYDVIKVGPGVFYTEDLTEQHLADCKETSNVNVIDILKKEY